MGRISQEHEFENWRDSGELGQDFSNGGAMDVCQTALDTVVVIREAFMIESE